MKPNLGSADRILRVIAAVAIGALYFTDQITGTAAIVLGVVAVAFVLTSAVGFCPMYAPFKWSTRKAESK
jgi:hypothetical protein